MLNFLELISVSAKVSFCLKSFSKFCVIFSKNLPSSNFSVFFQNKKKLIFESKFLIYASFVVIQKMTMLVFFHKNYPHNIWIFI